jgi:hypothetical protein
MKATRPSKPRQCICQSIQKYRVVSSAVQQIHNQVIRSAHGPDDLKRISQLRANAFYEVCISQILDRPNSIPFTLT